MLSSELKSKIKIKETDSVEKNIRKISNPDVPLPSINALKQNDNLKIDDIYTKPVLNSNDDTTLDTEEMVSKPTDSDNSTVVENNVDVVKEGNKRVSYASNIRLELGDIVEINAPSNSEMHMGVFYIDYVDESLISLIRPNNDIRYDLTVQNGLLDEESIKEIIVLSRSEQKGFVAQNEFEKGMWLNIRFEGALPFVITAEITDIEKDMLELRTYPKQETIYIDFQFKGIPKDLNIQSIEIRNAPEDDDQNATNDSPETPEMNVLQTRREEGKYDDSDTNENEYDSDNDKPLLPTQKQVNRTKTTERPPPVFQPTTTTTTGSLDRFDAINEGNSDNDLDEAENDVEYEEYNIQIEGDVQEVIQKIEITSEMKKYHIEDQKVDLLNDILSRISSANRTKNVLNEVDKVLSRYEELHQKYSKREADGMINQSLKMGGKYNSLIEYIKKHLFSQSNYSDPRITSEVLDWIVFVSQNTKMVYAKEEDDLNIYENSDINVVQFQEYLERFDEIYTTYKNAVTIEGRVDDENEDEHQNHSQNQTNSESTEEQDIAFYTFMHQMNDLWTPYRDSENIREELTRIDLSRRMETITDNGIDYDNHLMTSVIATKPGAVIKKRKFTRSVYVPEERVSIRSFLTYPTSHLFDLTYAKQPLDILTQLNINANLDQKLLSGNKWNPSTTSHQNIVQENDDNNDNVDGENTDDDSEDTDDSDTDVGNSTTKSTTNQIRTLTTDNKPDYVQSSKFLTKKPSTIPNMAHETILSTEIIQNEDISSLDKVNILLNTSIPSIPILFKMVQSELPPYATSSFYNISRFLRVFAGDWDNVHNSAFQEYIEMVSAYKSKYHGDLLQRIEKMRSLYTLFSKRKVHMNQIAKLLRETTEEEIISAYGLENKFLNTNGEHLFQYVMDIDNGKLLFLAIAKLDIELYTDINMKQILGNKMKELEQRVQEKNEQSIAGDNTGTSKSKTKCGELRLSKMYIAEDELQQDNGVDTLYYDQHYDDTRYEIADEYEHQADTMTSMEYKQFLINQLINSSGLNESNASIEAESLIEGKKRVREGDYAVLKSDTPETSMDRYFVRRENVWVEDVEISGANESLLFCNSNKDCITMKDDVCENIEDVQDKLETNATAQIMHSILEEESQEREEVKATILEDYKEQLNHVKREVRRRDLEKRKYDQYRYELSLVYQNDMDQVVNPISPFDKLREAIITITSLPHKMEMMDMFIKKNTRIYKKDADEDPKWLYCIVTNVKLLPQFYTRLVRAYKRGEAMFKLEQDKICNEQGFLSEDQDKWIDKHTNYIIKDITLSNQDNAYESVNLVDEEVANNTLYGEMVAEFMRPDENGDDATNVASTGNASMITNPDAINVRNVVSFLSSVTGMKMMEEIPFITRHVLRVLYRVVGTRESYRKRMEMAYAKKNIDKQKQKKLTELEITQKFRQDNHKFTLLLSGLMFLFSIQTSIPERKTKKTYQNCKKSFKGYPYEKEEGDTGLTYIFCIMKKSAKSGMDLWSSISRIKIEQLIKEIKVVGNKFILNDEEIKHRILERNRHDEITITDIPVSERIVWFQFLPRLNVHKMNLNKVMDLGKTFEKRLMDQLGNSSLEQHDGLSMLYGKLNAYALQLQYYIQTVMKKEDTYLEAQGEPYIENICCLEASQTNTASSNEGEVMRRNFGALSYFMKKQTKIGSVLENIKEIENILSRVKNLDTLPFIVEPENTSFYSKKVKEKIRYLTGSNPDSESSSSSSSKPYSSYILPRIRLSKQLIYSLFIEICKKKGSSDSLTPEMKTLCTQIHKIEKRYAEYIYDEEKQEEKMEEIISLIEKNGRNIDEHTVMSLLNTIYKRNSETYTTNQMLQNQCVGHMNLDQIEDWMAEVETMIVYNTSNTSNTSSRSRTQRIYDTEEEQKEAEVEQAEYNPGETYQYDETIFSGDFRKRLSDYLFRGENETFLNWLMVRNRELKDTLQTFMQDYLVNRSAQEMRHIVTILEDGFTISANSFSSIFTNLNATDYSLLHNIQTLKSFIEQFTKVFAHMMQGKHIVKHKIHSYWKLSNQHTQDIQNILDVHKEDWITINKTPVVANLYTRLRALYDNVMKLNRILPSLLQSGHRSSRQNSNTNIRDAEVSLQIHLYLLYSTLNRFVDEASIRNELDDDAYTQNSNLNIVADYMFLCLSTFNREFSFIQMTETTIHDTMIRHRDDEKNRIVRRLDNMTKDERKVDNLMKKAKLGEQWGVGMQSGLTKYDPDFYDRERNYMEEQSRLDMGNRSELTDASRELFEYDYMEEQMRSREIEEEEYDMRNLADDDDYGDEDGDM